MKKCRRCKTRTVWLAPLMVLALAGVRASAQPGCMNGTLLMSLGVNGTIKVCPGPDAKVPELQKKLDEIQTALNGNEALLREVTHAVRGVNALGRDVDANRQLELLHSLSRELEGWMAADQKQSQEQISRMADKLDALQDAIARSKEDQKTAQETTAALNGRLGDAIAALDLTNAQQQLESIQAKLDKIGDDVRQARKILEEQAAREKEAAEQERKKAEEQDKDPNVYTRAAIMPSKSPLNNQLRLMIFFYSRPPLNPPFIDSAFSISFRKGTGAAWRMDAADKQVSSGGELWHLTLNPADLGDRAAFCFVAHDKPSGRLREWVQHYKITPANTLSLGANFIPDGEAAMYLTDGEPCDGVKEVRSEPAPAPAASGPSPDELRKQIMAKAQEQMDELNRQQMAKTQEQIAAMRGQAPAPGSFARITADGSRRDRVNGGQWQIDVRTQPFRPGTTLYDVHVEANLVDGSGHVTPLQLSNRQLFVNIESRSAWVDRMGAKAVVCLTAKDPGRDKPYRLTQRFSIETTRVTWRDGGAQVPGDKATFVPSQPPTLTEASGDACQ